jgi:hypothetical protein
MDVIEVSRSTPIGSGLQSGPAATTELVTIYIDTRTYVVRRIEMRGLDARGTLVSEDRLDVATFEVLDPSAVPPGTFSFSPPPGVQMQQPVRHHVTAHK